MLFVTEVLFYNLKNEISKNVIEMGSLIFSKIYLRPSVFICV